MAETEKGSTDKTLGRLSTWTTVALVIGFLVLPFLPASDKRPATVPSLGHTPSATTPAAPAGGAPANSSGNASIAPGTPPVEKWSDAEQASALRECLVLLAPLAADITLSEPMRKGQCGMAAPLRLHSLGSTAKVVFEPAPEMDCKLAAGLSRWVDGVLQPAARDVLGSRIVRIIGASSYSCRNIYNLAVGPLSEHATGNAVDIAGFVTADGRTIMVAKAWGPTERDIAEAKKKATAARAHAGKGDAKAEAAKPSESEATDSADSKPGDSKSSDSKSSGTKATESGDSKPTAEKPGKEKRADAADQNDHSNGGEPAEQATEAAPELADAPVETGSTDEHAGGKSGAPGATQKAAHTATPHKALRATVVVPAAATLNVAKTTEAAFLKRLHQGACGVFGTVLGPEANDAHRSHFHFDMKERKVAAVCH